MEMKAPPLTGIPKPMKLIRPERCEKCRFSSAIAQTTDLECRRNPPHTSTFVIGTTRDGRINLQTVGAFPRMVPTAWCGEFKPFNGDIQ
jgi:hypothetical protein